MIVLESWVELHEEPWRILQQSCKREKTACWSSLLWFGGQRRETPGLNWQNGTTGVVVGEWTARCISAHLFSGGSDSPFAMCFKEIDGHQIYSHTARTPIYGNLRDFGILTMWVGPLVPHDMLEPPIRCYGSHCISQHIPRLVSVGFKHSPVFYPTTEMGHGISCLANNWVCNCFVRFDIPVKTKQCNGI